MTFDSSGNTIRSSLPRIEQVSENIF